MAHIHLPTNRRAFSLIEILVGLALTAIVISFCLGYLRQLTTTNLKAKALKREVVVREIAFLKLSRIFSEIDHTTYPMRTQPDPNAKKDAFFFSFEQAQPDLKLSQFLNAKLYLNRRNEIRLEMTGASGVQQDELLLDKVSDLSFSFFCPEEKCWLSEWPLKKEGTPSLIKITVLPEGKDAVPHTFPFILTHGKEAMVSYKGIKS